MNVLPEHLLNLVRFQELYRDNGYKIVGVPWKVTHEAAAATVDDEARLRNSPLPLTRSWDIGSGEQGFVQRMLDGTLSPGRYQTLTPCFRVEQAYDELHLPHFLKIELIIVGEDEDPRTAWWPMASLALRLIQQHGHLDCGLVSTPEGADLMCSGVELGSYGFRKFQGHRWAYGTGLAEPRFSLVKGKKS